MCRDVSMNNSENDENGEGEKEDGQQVGDQTTSTLVHSGLIIRL